MKLIIDDTCNDAELLHYKIVLLTQITQNQEVINEIDEQLEKLKQSRIREEKMAHYISQLGENNIN